MALVFDFVGPYVAGEGWRISPATSPSATALIVIIALGESIVASASAHRGSSTRAWSPRRSSGWSSRGAVVDVLRRRGASWPSAGCAGRGRRGRMARDSFSYLHFPMIAGIVLFALGVKKSIATSTSRWRRPGGSPVRGTGALPPRPRRLPPAQRAHPGPPTARVAALLLAYIRWPSNVAALAALAATAIYAGLIVFEVTRYREARTRMRVGLVPPRTDQAKRRRGRCRAARPSRASRGRARCRSAEAAMPEQDGLVVALAARLAAGDDLAQLGVQRLARSAGPRRRARAASRTARSCTVPSRRPPPCP